MPVETAANGPGGVFVARRSREYAIKRLLIVVMLVGSGAWFAVDGFIRWPNENAKLESLKSELAAHDKKDEEGVRKLESEIGKLMTHSGKDLLLQRGLAIVLPPVGIAVLILALWVSRGEYRLRENILNVPGHPPVQLDHIRSIDKSRWDKKGIALLNYELPSGKAGTLKLDDFIYERPPTDGIFEYIQKYLGVEEGSEAATTASDVTNV